MNTNKSSNNVHQLYFKITNAEEKHHKFQYYDGLNTLKDEFNDNPKDSCVASGLYFTLSRRAG